MSLQWYVVHAYSGFENQVKRALEERIKRAGMEDAFGEILVPTEEVVEMREGTKRRSERKFFPGYVLVQMDMNEDTWHLVKDAPKVLGFIGGTSDRPAPITQREAEGAVRGGRSGTGYRWSVQRLQRRCRRSELREEPAAGFGADFRAFDAG